MSGCNRRGSVLLFCIALVGALAVLAYGFVRVAQLGANTGDSANLHLLARQAAQTGLNHAIEQLVRDYVREPYTRMDSPAIAMNVSHDYPYFTGYTYYDAAHATGSQKLNTDSIAGENSLDNVTTNGAGNTGAFSSGASAFYPISRFYEPEFYNLVSAPAGVTTTSQVSTPVRFNSAWPGPPYPDRSNGLFYNQQLRRINGAKETARENARYRLRYAIMTQDLEGMFLVNGDQAVNYREINTTDPGNPGLSAAAARVVRNMHKVPPVLLAEDGWAQNNSSNIPYIWIDGPLRAEHVFTGRGSTANVDTNPAKGNAPATFPLMYRWQNNAQSFLEYSNPSVSPDGWPPAENLFSKTTSTTVSGLAAGAEIISDVSQNWSGKFFEHILTGPAFTPSDFQAATYGHGNRELNSLNTGNGNQVGHVTTLGRYTVFGRGVSKRVGGESVSRYRGNTDTPWCLNILTIAPNVVRGMMQGYMPPGAIHTLYSNAGQRPAAWEKGKGYTLDKLVINGIGIYRCTVAGTSAASGTGPTGTGAGITDGSVTWAHLTDWSDPDSFRAAVLSQRDLFISPLSPAFQRYAPPARTSPAISPDFHLRAQVASDPGYRNPKDRYPGKMGLNGYDASVTHADDARDLKGKWTSDNLGTYLRSTQSTLDEFGQSVSIYLPSGRYRAKHLDKNVPFYSSNNTNGPIPSHASGSLHGQISHGSWGYPNPICSQMPLKPVPADYTAWAKNTAYTLGQQVTNAGNFYTCIKAGTSCDPTVSPFPSAPTGSGIIFDGTVVWQTYDTTAYVTAHHDSIWDSVAHAMANAVAMTQGQYLQYTNNTTPGGPNRQQSAFFDGLPWIDNSTVPGVSRTGSIADLDALFVTNLGHSWLVPNDPAPVAVWYGVGGYPWKLGKTTPTWNIAALNPASPKCLAMASNPGLMPSTGVPVLNIPLASSNDPAATFPLKTDYGTAGSPVINPISSTTGNPFWDASDSKNQYNATYRTQLMELIVNDIRLSFFGSSPQYGSRFRAFDFNGDGKACCSGFDPNPAATTDETLLHIDQYTTSVDTNGIATVEVNNYFSNTGCFFIGKSRFWRVIVRGEVWDNFLKVSNNTVDLDSVICIDPTDADNAMTAGSHNPGRQYATHLLYQAWMYNNYRSLLPRRE